MQIEEAK